MQEEEAKRLLKVYHEYQKKLYSGGKEYQDIPDGIFESLESDINRCGYEIVRPHPHGLISLMKKEVQ